MAKRKMECSEEELRRIVTEHGSQILRLCVAYLGDRQLGEDAAQETFFSVYEKYGTCAGNSSELTWILRIAINKCRNIMRKKHFGFEVLQYGLSLPEPAQMEYQESMLLEKIEKLPQMEREAILLYYYQELDIKEISACCGVMEATIRQRLKRGRDRLKIVLEREGFCG